MHRFVKLLNRSCCHNGFQFSEGLNVDTEKFDPEKLCYGGLYFCRLDDFYKWLYYRDDLHYICDVTLPDDARICDEGDKLKADKLILLNKRTISEFFHTHPEFILPAAKANGRALMFIKNPSPEVCLAVVRIDSSMLVHVKNQTDEICLAAVSTGGLSLLHVRQPTPAICMTAVQQDGHALRYVTVQTPDLCLAAVQQNGLALEHVLEQTDAIQLAAIHNDPRAYYFARNPSPFICTAARNRYRLA